MKKSMQLALSILCVFLLLVSFPARDIWDNRILSDICRIVGFGLVIILAVVKLMKKQNE